MRTIWLASYPKSGNTWLRLLLANMSSQATAPVDINSLADLFRLAGAREPFDHFLLIDSGLLTQTEVDSLRPRFYEELARGNGDDEPAQAVRFVKVHDAYTLTGKGEALLAGARGAQGAVVIVRDPRDIAPSLANHLGSNIDEAIDFMNDRNAEFSGQYDRQNTQFRQKLLGWSGHVATWLGQSDIPVCLIRYEDMHTDTVGTLGRVLSFAGQPAAEADIARATVAADFAKMQAQEKEQGFREAPWAGRGVSGVFFRRGEVGRWRDELTAEQVRRIERDHTAMMIHLGYAPACGI